MAVWWLSVVLMKVEVNAETKGVSHFQFRKELLKKCS
jgi:hypothetical protein